VRGVGEEDKLSLPGPLLHLRGPSCLTMDVAGFEASGRPSAPLYPCAPSVVLLLPPSLCLDKRRGRKKGESEKRDRRRYQDLKGATLPCSLSHGIEGFIPFHHYAEPPAKTHEAWVYGGGVARVLSGASGPRVPHACGRICGVIYSVL
jgi:hypothetical protein